MPFPTIIPGLDPMPLPAPYFIFKLLLIVTFLLHILAMNVMFGGGMLAAIARIKGRKEPLYARLAGDISKQLPSFLAATITLGIAPLLFTQVIYGHFLYTSSVLMAWPWLSVVLLLIFAYYGFYIVAFKKEQSSCSAGWFAGVSLLLIFVIGFIYSHNFSLMLNPEKWFSMYLASGTGWHLNWGESTLFPRYLHFFLAALAIGGLYIAVSGFFRWKSDEPYARLLIRFGGKWFAYVTMMQVVVGLWFVMALKREVMLLFMGRNMFATVLFALGFVLGLAVIPLATRALKKADPRPGMRQTMILTAALTVIMVLMRDIVRDGYLAAHFQPDAFQISPQWDVLILFLVLFAGGIYTWVWMMRKYFTTHE